LTELHSATGGEFASTRVVGNLGSQIFHNFIMTFDYEHRSLYLRPSPDFGYSMPYNRSGIHLDMTENGDISVTSVNESSPGALAGVQEHDQVLAINNRPVSGQPYSEIQELLSQPAGTCLNIDVLRNGERKHFLVTLRELLPTSGDLHVPADLILQ
jgi:predicted metalloprotease with PDZ domain